MAKTVSNRDIFESGLFTKTTENAKQLLTVLDQLEQGFKEVAQAQKEIVNNEDQKTIQSVQRTKTAVQELTDIERQAIKIQRQKKSLTDQLAIAQSKEGKSLAKTRVEIQKLNKVNKQAALENKKLVGSYTALSNRLNRVRKEYKDLAASEGIASKKTIALRNEVIKLDTQLKRIDRTVGQSQRNVGNYGNSWQKVGTTLKSGLGFLGVASGAALIGRALVGATKTIREFDESVANIAKVTGFAKEDARELAEEILKIDTRTSVTELLALAEAGGRLGLTGREFIAFTQSTDKAFVALGDSLEGSAEDIGVSLGKVASVFGAEKEFGIAESINKIGSSLNDLGAKSKANEGRIQDFTTRLAGVGTQAGLSIPEVQALGAFFDEAGQSVEVSSSTLNKLLPAIGKDVKKFARVAGKDIKEFEKLVAEKPLEALKAVAKGAKSSEKGLIGLSKTLANYGIDSSRAAGIVGVLSENTDRLTELQVIANEAFAEGTSLQEEFAIKNETLNARVEKLGNTYDKMIISIENGEGILSDVFKGAISGADSLLQSINDLSIGFGGLTDKAIGGREEYLKAVESFGLGFEGIGTSLARANKFIEAETDRIAKDFVDKDRKTQRTITANLLKRIKSDTKLLKTQSGLETLATEKRINANLLLLEKLRDITIAKKANNDEDDKSIGKAKELTGLIEDQTEVVSKLNEQIQKARSEDRILELSIKLDVETEELDRLKRIVSSSFEEIDKIQEKLIKDSTERRIVAEQRKSDDIIAKIESNSRITEETRIALIKAENERIVAFVNNEEIKSGKKRIKAASDSSKAEFEQTRTGFETQKAFEIEKAEQFKAIRKNAIEDEIALIEQFGGEGSELRIKQLKAELEGLAKIGDETKKLEVDMSEAIDAIGELIDESFEKRIEVIDKLLESTGDRVDQLRDKATEGQLASEESLAFEQKKQVELERQRQRELKRQERAKAFFTVLTAFNNNDGNIGKTITDVSVLKALAGQLTGFEKGGYTGDGGTKEVAGVTHGKEFVIDAKKTKELGLQGKSMSDFNKMIGMNDDGFLKGMLAGDRSNDFMSASAFKLNGLSNRGVEKRLDTLNESINGFEIPEGTVSFDHVRGLINLVTRKGNRVTKEISKLHK